MLHDILPKAFVEAPIRKASGQVGHMLLDGLAEVGNGANTPLRMNMSRPEHLAEIQATRRHGLISP